MTTESMVGQRFGTSVSIDGSYAIIGTECGSSPGSAYIFERSLSGNWAEASKLTASDAATDDFFGCSVSISGNYAVVGASANDDAGTSSGSAYIFKRGLFGGWTEVAKLTASDPEEGELFGWSVAIDGPRALVGALWDNENGDDSGAAYVFDRGQNGQWNETTKLIASDGSAGDSFGISISLDGELAIVGANRGWHTPEGATSAYVYEHGDDSTWTEVAKLSGRNDLRDYFGEAVSISNGNALVGAYADDHAGLLSGAAYIFVPEPGTLGLLLISSLILSRAKLQP